MNPATLAPFLIPSPTVAAIQLGPLAIRFYALCILAGIIIAVWLAGRRLTARGGTPGVILDITLWAVPFGIAGGRLYHVITDPQLYFVPGKNPWNALKIWDGGLGIWGAVALGLLGAYIGCRRHNVPFATLIDAAAPGLLIAQGLGRWGNWFNNELYGGTSTAPWKLQIHQMDFTTGQAVLDTSGAPVVLGYFQPTFLYESLWCLAAAAVLLILDKKFRLGAGSVFALYIIFYTSGRFVFELLRSDYANTILGLRVNTWVSGLLLLAGALWFLAVRRKARSTVNSSTSNSASPSSSPDDAAKPSTLGAPNE